MLELDFIKRCNNLFKTDVKREDRKRYLYRRLYYENNREYILENHKKYCRSKNGKKSAKRRDCISGLRYRNLTKELSKEELECIRQFYLNTPKGYEVDHIIPLSKGGQHVISNLQYLKTKENRQKGSSLSWKPKEKGAKEKLNEYIKNYC